MCPIAPFLVIKSENDIHKAFDGFGLPCIMKTATGGYDGKGQWTIKSKVEIPKAIEVWDQAGIDMIIEKFIPFRKELSVIVAPNIQGQAKSFPIAENIHVKTIQHQSIFPARITEEKEKEKRRNQSLLKLLNPKRSLPSKCS